MLEYTYSRTETVLDARTLELYYGFKTDLLLG